MKVIQERVFVLQNKSKTPIIFIKNKIISRASSALPVAEAPENAAETPHHRPDVR